VLRISGVRILLIGGSEPMSATRLGAPSPQNLSDPNKRSSKVKVTASESKSDSHLFGPPDIEHLQIEFPKSSNREFL
jgi:hypothetical protein